MRNGRIERTEPWSSNVKSILIVFMIWSILFLVHMKCNPLYWELGLYTLELKGAYSGPVNYIDYRRCRKTNSTTYDQLPIQA